MSGYFWTVFWFAVVFVPLETLFAARKAPAEGRWRRRTVALLYITVGHAMIVAGTVAVGLVLAAVIGAHTMAESWPLWLQVVLALVLGDLGIWIAHFLSHKVPFLWRFHRIHHSAETMNWTVAFRVHPVDQVWDLAWKTVPALALGFSTEAIAIYGAFYGWYSVLLHANLTLPYGPLGKVFSSPQFHHWHHAAEPEAFDRNYAAVFALWDTLFGTRFAAPTLLPRGYGADEPVAEDFLVQMIAPFAPQRKKPQVVAV